MQLLNVSALVTGYETVDDHTEFVIQVSCNGWLWLISRRFSDFDQLHSRLTRQFGNLIEARLPEKQWFGRFDPNFLMKRQSGLQEYMESLLQVPGILDDPSLRHFLEIERQLELHGDPSVVASANGRPSGFTNEQDRLNGIVDTTGQAFIDISEVPAPLEPEQARQKQYQIASVAHSSFAEQKLVEHVANALTVLSLPCPAIEKASNESIVARLAPEMDPTETAGGSLYEQDQELLWQALEKADPTLRVAIVPPSLELCAVMVDQEQNGVAPGRALSNGGSGMDAMGNDDRSSLPRSNGDSIG